MEAKTNNYQRDQRWGNLYLGNSNTFIKDYGCTISVIGDIVQATPDIVNQKLLSVGGFSGNLVIWDKIAVAFPNFTVKRVWSFNSDEVFANTPNVIVEVPAYPIGGTGRHWVNYISHTELQDPWTGKIRPISDFPNPTGYCLIIPKGGIPTPPPSGGGTTVANLLDKNDREGWRVAVGYSYAKSPSVVSEKEIDDAIASNYPTPLDWLLADQRLRVYEPQIKESYDKGFKDGQANIPIPPIPEPNPNPIPNPGGGTGDNTLIADLLKQILSILKKIGDLIGGR